MGGNNSVKNTCIKEDTLATATSNSLPSHGDWSDSTPRMCSAILETHNMCTRRCASCKHGQKRTFPEKWMSEAVVEKCAADLAQIDYSEQISLVLNNEPLLDKRLCKFVRLLAKSAPKAKILLFTNGDLLDHKVLKDLFDAGLRLISVSIYDKDAVGRMEEYASCFGADRVRLSRTFDNDLSETFHNFGGNIKGDMVNQQKVIDRGCMLPFRQAVVTTDGFLGLCCLDCYSDVLFDNVMDKPLHDIFMNNVKLNAIRERLKTSRKGLSLCENCSYGGGYYRVVS